MESETGSMRERTESHAATDRVRQYCRGMFSAIMAVSIVMLCGCSAVGPAAIRDGRIAYNQAITQTNNQQMLMNVIHNRYEERSVLLAVASVTANVRLTAASAVQIGIGDRDNYVGNLVPFAGGAVYEENPTISYSVVEGERYYRQLMLPVPVDSFAQLARTLSSADHIYPILISSINDIQNPEFLASGEEPDPRFDRFVAIMSELKKARRLDWMARATPPGEHVLVINDYEKTYASQVDELLDLLGLPMRQPGSNRITIPIVRSHDGREEGGIGVTTRSVFDLVEILSAAVEIPERDQRAGAATQFPPMGKVGQALRIHFSESRPDDAYVAVPLRGGWFYIEDADLVTKRYFRVLTTLWGVAIAAGSGGSPSPVLTVPVSR